MATTTIPTLSITVLLFLFVTLSRARDLQNPATTTRSQSSKPQQHDTVSFNLKSIHHVPLTFLDFRPINRHINPHRLSPLDLPFSTRRFRHGHRHQIHYGNDMILKNDANIADRRIQKRLAKIHGGEVMFPQMMYQYPHHVHSHDHHHHHHHHHHEKGWFAKKIHQFLNLF